MSEISARSIYATGAPVYRDAGWRGVLPVNALDPKRPGVGGFTGYDGRWPTDAEIAEWKSKRPNVNLCLRVEHGVLVLDVDNYDDKTGGKTIEEAERPGGPLPPTYRSTSRLDDPVSGQRFYRVPLGVLFRPEIKFADLGLGHVETIQPHLRVSVVWPSIHPKTGQVYRWFGPDGSLLPEGVVPRVDDLPDLPPEWVEGLQKGALRDEVFDGSAPNRSRALRNQINQEMFQRLIGIGDDGVAPERLVAECLEKAVADLMSGTGSRYEVTRDHVARLTRLRTMGRLGVPAALHQLHTAYVLEVGDIRPALVADAEFRRFTDGAAMLIAATPSSGPQAEAGQPAEAGAAPESWRPSWSPIDLTEALTGDTSGVAPTLLRRTDGVCLLYPGMTHSLHGESESGKSLVVQAECVRLIGDGQRVLYFDFESDEQSVVDRLVKLGADEQAVADHFHYVRPEVAPNQSDAERAAWEAILGTEYTLAVIDGVTEALTVFGRASLDNDDVAAWSREVPRRIAERTGAAVVLIDHVVKNKTQQGRHAIGGQAKMAALTGAAYTVEVLQPLGVGMRGSVGLRVGKDRPGQVRNQCGAFRKGDRTQMAARVVIDSTGDHTTVTVEPWDTNSPQETTGSVFRPTHLMERISRVMATAPEPKTKSSAVTEAGGKRTAAMSAFDILVQDGYLTMQGKRNGHPLYVSVKPYSETSDLSTSDHQD